MKVLEGEGGSALIFSLLVLLVVTLLSTGLLTMAQVETRMAFYQYRSTAAFYLAEAGLEKMAALLALEPHHREGFRIKWDGGGETEVSIVEEGDYLRVTSRGMKEGVQRSLATRFQLVDHRPLIAIGETIMCAGDFHVILPPGLEGFPRVEGGVLCSGEAQIPQGMDISLKMEDFTFPPMADWELYRRELKGQSLRPDELAGQRELEGFIYVDGDVELTEEGDGIAGSAVLMITGSLVVSGDAALEGNFVIMAAQGIFLTGITRVKGLLYTPGMFCCIGGEDGYISGKVWSGGGVELGGGIKIGGHGGKEDELLHNLPPTLVLEKMWYRVTRSYLIQ